MVVGVGCHLCHSKWFISHVSGLKLCGLSVTKTSSCRIKHVRDPKHCGSYSQSDSVFVQLSFLWPLWCGWFVPLSLGVTRKFVCLWARHCAQYAHCWIRMGEILSDRWSTVHTWVLTRLMCAIYSPSWGSYTVFQPLYRVTHNYIQFPELHFLFKSVSKISKFPPKVFKIHLWGKINSWTETNRFSL